MLQDCLYHEVSKLIIDQRFNTVKAFSDQLSLPVALGRSNTVFAPLAAILILSNLGEMLNYWLVDSCASLISPEKDQTLANHIIACQVTTQLDNAHVFEGLLQDLGDTVCPLVMLDELVL